MSRQSSTAQVANAEPASLSEAGRVLQRKCDCGTKTAGGQCGACSRKALQPKRNPANSRAPASAPESVHSVIGSTGGGLDASTRTFMESRFGQDFSGVRVHTDARAQASARAVGALAYTVGRDIAFGAGQYAPHTGDGRRLIAHELAHVVQQGGGLQRRAEGEARAVGDEAAGEQEADAAADAVLSDRPVGLLSGAGPSVQRVAGPYIKKVTVHLTPPESADLEWEGTPPATAVGLDHFTVSTGKGYSDSGDPAGTCTRSCCTDAATQCASPWNRPGRVGACCTYVGNNFWTGTPVAEHNTWHWWTPIQPFYSTRGIALHQHPEVTGQAIGHGCVRMDEDNARRIHDFSRGRNTNVTIDGTASPVSCEAARQCTPPTTPGTGGTGVTPGTTGGTTGSTAGGGDPVATATPEAVPGLEGAMS